MGQYREKDIVIERGAYFALRIPSGFEVYKIGLTHSTRCAQIGFCGDEGMRRASDEIDRRIAVDSEARP